MAGISEAILSRLLVDTAVASLIGNRVAAAGGVPQGLARPNIAYQWITGRGTNSNDGPTGLKRKLLQLSCYADYPDEARALARAVGRAGLLDGFAGTVTLPDMTDVRIQSCLLDDERDAPELPTGGKGSGIPGIVLVYNVAFIE